MDAKYLEKFDWMARRLEELSIAVAQPDIIADLPRWQSLLRERAALEPAVAWLPESEGNMLHLGSFASFVDGLEAAAGAAEGEHKASAVLSCSVLISCVLALVMALAGGLTSLPLPAVALYQVAWAVLAMIFPMIQRY